MSKNISTIVLLSYLILFINPINMIVLKNQANKLSLVTTQGIDLTATANKCMSALMNSIPAEFCWKKGADFGVIPTGCPSGYFRSLALCYEYCAPSYRHVLGVCWQDCKSGYTDHGLSCFKNLFSWYFKHSYIPGSITNFSSRVPCPEGMYRSGALCYRDCNNIGLQNCGIGACASDGLTCGTKIAGMVKGVFEGIATAISTVVTFGGATAVKSGLKTGIKALGKAAINAVKNRMKNIFTSNLKNTIYNKAKDVLKDKLIEFSSEIANNIIPSVFCQGVWNESEKKFSLDADLNEDRLLSAIDIFDVKGTIKNCSNVSADGGLSCASSVISTLSNFDPTGMLTIAAAFMHPTCDVTTKDYRIGAPPEVLESIESQAVTNVLTDCSKFEPTCVHLWSQCNFTGTYYKACGDQDLHSFNDIAKSAYVGGENSVSFFEHMGYNGRFLNFGPGTTIKCFDDYSSQVNLTGIISSVKFNVNHCYIINFRTSYSTYQEGSNRFLCYYENANHVIDIREDSTVDNKLIVIKTAVKGAKLTLFEEINFSGKSKLVDGSVTFEGKSELGLSKIGSYKITVS